MSSDRRRAVVTGSSSGIGHAIATHLLGTGWQVTGLDVAAPSIAQTGFEGVRVDLSDPATLAIALSRLIAPDTPAAFVHAAGLLRTGSLGGLNPDDGETLWKVHVDAATRIADVLLPAMAAAGTGRVVLVGSRVSRGVAGRSQYAASKAALGSLARSWAAEVVASGVTVNVVSPGATETPMLIDPKRSGTPPRLPPLGRFVRPAEVAALVAFLLSDDAAAITGQDIVVCGGSSLDRGGG